MGLPSSRGVPSADSVPSQGLAHIHSWPAALITLRHSSDHKAAVCWYCSGSSRKLGKRYSAILSASVNRATRRIWNASLTFLHLKVNPNVSTSLIEGLLVRLRA